MTNILVFSAEESCKFGCVGKDIALADASGNFSPYKNRLDYFQANHFGIDFWKDIFLHISWIFFSDMCRPIRQCLRVARDAFI